MQTLIPFAAAQSPAAGEALNSLQLPNLERLLALTQPAALTPVAPATAGNAAQAAAAQRDDLSDALSLNPPHERALAAAWGWTPQPDGLLPLAAAWAAADGLAPQALATAPDGDNQPIGWGLLSPTHWHVGTEQVSLSHPDALELDASSARAVFDALKPLFDDEGLPLQWGAPTRWYIAHERLATLPTASLDRVVGRNVDLWLNSHPDARLFRRLQAEVQTLLHTHPLNAEREDHGLLPVNSFWLSGTGRPQPISPAARVQVLDALRGPALAEDWTAWAEAWATLDAGPIRELLATAQAGQPVSLTLCGEQRAQRLGLRPRSMLQRLFGARRQSAAAVLQGL